MFLISAAASAQQMGSIRGVVYDQDFDAPLALPEITIAETGQTVTGTEQGNYVFEQVPPGTYTLVFSKEGYTRQVKADVVVSPGQLTDVDASLIGEFAEMEEFVVQDVEIGGGTEAGLLQLRFESPALLDSISAELMSQAGAGDAAAALKLVAGATVSEGKFAVIRGLPDRYVSSQMNSVRLPSADADTRAVELDQFPSAVIESIQVSKTFTPDQQGDASGGAVNVVLKGIPEENIFQIGFGTKVNTQVVGRDDFLTYKRGGVNFLGIDDGRRDIPPDPDGTPNPLTPDFTGAMGVTRDDAPINYDFDMTLGGKHEFDNGVTIGAIATTFYERDSSFFDNGVDDSLWLDIDDDIGDPLTPQYRGSDGSPDSTSLLDVTQGSQEVKWGALGTFGVETENHAITLAFMHTHATEDTATLAEDTRGKQYIFPGHIPGDLTTPGNEGDRNIAPYIRLETLQYTERTTQTVQLNGRHTLPIPEVGIEDFFTFLSPKLDWTLSTNSAEYKEPDKRQFGSQWVPEWELFPGFTLPSAHSGFTPAAQALLGNAQRTWEEIVEDSDQYSVNLKFPFEQWTGDEGYVKLGLFQDEVTRKYTQESFSNYNYFPENTVLGLSDEPFEVFWSDVFPSQGPIFAAEPDTDDAPGVEDGTDVDYDGAQNISAWYYMVDLPLTSFLNVIGGVRFETMEMSITTTPEDQATVIVNGESQSFFFPSPPTRAIDPVSGLPVGDSQFEQSDVLPSIGLIFTPFEEVTFRASYTETVARQTFKELSPVIHQEYLGGDIFVGNPNLQMPALTNYDLRLDYRPYEGGLISVSWFKKDIDKPIEYVQKFDTGIGRYTTATNFPQGELTGYEIEVRQDLGHFRDQLEGLSIGANATFIDSEVMLPESEVSTLDDALGTPGAMSITSREMLNAPERLINAYLTYELETTGTQFGIFYTIKGDTLVVGPGQINSRFVPAIYAEEYDTLNITVSQKIGKYIKLSFAAKNLTNPEIQEVYRSDFIQDDAVKTSYTQGIEFSVGISAEIPF